MNYTCYVLFDVLSYTLIDIFLFSIFLQVSGFSNSPDR